MNISEFLSPADVLVDIRVSDKRQLLHELARKAASRLSFPADHIAAELLKREELGSTGTGSGIAIPHARIPVVTKSFGVLVRLRQPIDFDAIDGKPVDLVFLLLMPTTADRNQLDALSSVARRLRASEILFQLRCAKNAAELYSAIVG